MNKKFNCDVAIVGGGPVGLALALALRDNDLNVVLLEAREAAINTTDPRALAIAYGSRLLLQRLGTWEAIPNVNVNLAQRGHTVPLSRRGESGNSGSSFPPLKPDGNAIPAVGRGAGGTGVRETRKAQTIHHQGVTCAMCVSGIHCIEITQKNSAGQTTLRAAELNVPEMGYVLPYTALHAALQQALHQTDIRCVYGAAVSVLDSAEDHAVLTYQHQGKQHTLHARLAVVADGGKLLEAAHPPEITDYGQSGIIAHVNCTHARAGMAFEHFTPQGPMALLPYLDGYELVLTTAHKKAEEMLAWDDAAFLAFLQSHFGDRVGTFTAIGPRSGYPLRLKRAPDLTFPHTVLIGNAAQTLHPVAGQGFNLGLRDAWELAQVILDHAPDNIGSAAMCAAYRQSRRLDRNAGIRFTDGLVRLFSNDLPLLGLLRSAALSLLDHLPLAKKFVAKRMMFGANG